ncbi:hypothetical protein [Parvularcula sp. IMCC14364]|uniref:hypothetical protein n=1 Tax=Parvularcula sp. IMCC14364 TaxID=3067902 RepID=UPI002741D145|nr:hypothetical protein [Parvularcula sp. IMCC14364]
MTVYGRALTAIVIALVFGIGSFAIAEEAPWWEPLVCPEINPKASGGSPETARRVELVDLFAELDAVADAYDNFNFDEELPPPLPKETLGPNCEWVEFEGYFKPVRYQNFRGQMLNDVADHYLAGGPIGLSSSHFWVENWGDQSIVSHALHNRRIRIKARVYDQCLAVMQYDRQRKELGFRFGGACHYGENTGMILTDVEVVDVLSQNKVIAQLPDLSDVLGRPAKIAKLTYPPVHDSENEPLQLVEGLPSGASEVVREWMRRIKSGPEAMIRNEQKRGQYFNDRREKQIREYFEHPDGRYGFLNAQPGFALLDPDEVTIKFFATKPFGESRDAQRNWNGFGCIALSPKVNWPVAAIDAEHSISTFACAEIHLWDDEWRNFY